MRPLNYEKLKTYAKTGNSKLKSSNTTNLNNIDSGLDDYVVPDLNAVLEAEKIAVQIGDETQINKVNQIKKKADLLLNLKGIVVKSTNNDVSFGRLKVKGPAVITADSIQLPSNIEIVNPNHYIATISTSNVLEIEFKFEHGTGYKLAGQTFCDKSEDFLQIDAIFMPIQKVDFKIENVYDNSNSITERLFLDIWTNGSISPEDAISAASKFIIELFNSIMENKFSQEIDTLQNTGNLTPINPHINIAIEELQLSVRAYNCLKRAQINTIGDLLEYSPEKLQELKNFGRKSADEVFTTLKNKLGIVLK